ncbi:MAG: RIP metalloprotease RseP [Nitrospinae bacterium]|nr:RIP metalloprotease RseP [Nitrospinota bacterium]
METIISAVVLLGVLIFVHELGHFLVAKRSGVGVKKFSLGFGPKIIGKMVGETEYLVSAVPLGGYVKLEGEEPDEEVTNPEKSFTNKSVGTRLAIVSAGPIFNLLFAVAILALVFMIGVKAPSDSSAVGNIKQGGAAESAGLVKGDMIIEIDGKKVDKWHQMAEIIHKSPNKELSFKVRKERGAVADLKITPRAETVKDIFGKNLEVGLIGIEPLIVTERYNPVTATLKGFERTYDIIYLTFWAIVKMITGDISAKNIGGPIMIFQKAGEFANEGFLPYATFAALISINLGILNLLPIPVLDGGHILFFLIEIILRKPVSIKLREAAQHVGIFLLVSLMLFAFYNDIMRFFEQ